MHGKRFPGRGVETLKLEVGRKTNDGRRALRPGGGDVCPDHPVKGFRACSNSGFQHPAQGAGIPFHGMPPTEVASFTLEATMIGNQAGYMKTLVRTAATTGSTLTNGV